MGRAEEEGSSEEERYEESENHTRAAETISTDQKQPVRVRKERKRKLLRLRGDNGR